MPGEPEILNNGTVFDTGDGDIAHITCMSRGEPRSLVRWEKEGRAVKDKDEGIAVLSRNNGSLQESHLFVAVTSSDRRGEYVCVVTNENGVAKQSFRIKGNRTFILFCCIFFVLRGCLTIRLTSLQRPPMPLAQFTGRFRVIGTMVLGQDNTNDGDGWAYKRGFN